MALQGVLELRDKLHGLGLLAAERLKPVRQADGGQGASLPDSGAPPSLKRLAPVIIFAPSNNLACHIGVDAVPWSINH